MLGPLDAPPPSRRWLRIPIGLPPEGGMQAFELEGHHLLLCHVDGLLHVLRNECSHGRTPLAEGKLRGHLLECPLHGGRIDVRDGTPAKPPIRRPVCVYPTRRGDAGIEVALPGDGARSPA